MSKRLALIFISLTAFASFGTHAENYPDKTIRLVVPFSPGGTADLLGRLLAQKLSDKYHQSVVVENRPGAAGNIGAENVARSTPDGYTLLLGTIGIHSTFQIYPHLKYDPTKDLKPVSILADTPNVLVVAPGTPWKNVKDVIADATAHPNMLTFGSAGFGSSTHMAAELFKYDAKVQMQHIPFKGSGPSLIELMAGRIKMMFENLPTALPLIKSKQIRALAVTSSERAASLPDVPTIAKDGLPAYAFTAWFTIAVPAGTPDAIVNKLNTDIRQIMFAMDLQPKLADMGISPVPKNRDAAASRAFIDSETQKFGVMIKEQHIVAE